MSRQMRSYYLDRELLDGLDTIRDRDGILPSEQVRRAIAMWLKAKNYRQRPQRKRGKAKK